MKARQRCEICNRFKVVGFTDCGLICEQCYYNELCLNAFNQAVDAAIRICEEAPDAKGINIVERIRDLHKQEHKKEEEI